MNKKNLNINSLKSLASVLPDNPGVYQFYNSQGEILYIGKAKNLKKRVSSYITKSKYESNKLRLLVRKIADIKHIIVDSESDALLLENNLIKKYQPRYNVQLKDDKTYPWICVKNERFPRVFSTRNIIKDGSKYYGPYTSGLMVRTILELIKQLYPLRICKHILTEGNIKKNKFKICLEYHIENCKAPCVGWQNEADYDNSIVNIKNILKGNIQDALEYLKNLMGKFSGEYKFEEAEFVKNKIKVLGKYKSKSTIVNPAINNVDIFSIIDDEKHAFVNFIKVVNGAIIQSHTLEMKKKLDEKKEELLPMAITEIRQRLFSNAKEILVPFQIDLAIPEIKLIVPKRGDKKMLLELSMRNVKFFQLEKEKQLEEKKTSKHINRILKTIKKDLHLKKVPVHIECFDNSNIQGSNPVAACVVFRNAKPSKKDYRHYNIKTVKGPNDYASMEEVVFRRYKRLLEEKKSLPQLVIIDGGKGQLNCSVKSLQKLNLHKQIAVIGIAKRLEEIYFPGDSIPLYLDKNSETLKIIQHLRNEAHRFGISFHRDKRSKDLIHSELENIRGIGKKTAELLLTEFKSVENIKKAKINEIEKIIGKTKGKLIKEYFKRE